MLARAVLCGERLTSHDVRLRRCACVHCTGYGANAVYSSSLMSCPFCVCGPAESHGSGKQSPPNPKGVTRTAARTILFLVLPVHSCREGPEHFGPPFSHSVDRDGSGLSGHARASPDNGLTTRNLFGARHWIHNPQPQMCTGQDSQP